MVQAGQQLTIVSLRRPESHPCLFHLLQRGLPALYCLRTTTALIKQSLKPDPERRCFNTQPIAM